MKSITKRIFLMLLVLSCAGTMLTGCGVKNVTTDKKVTLKLWTKPTQDASEEIITKHDRMIDALQKKFPDIVFEESIPPQGGNDYRQEYDKALMAGTAPAIYTQFSYTDIPSRIENNTISDITSFVDKWELKKEGKTLTTFDNAISKDGKWYALPCRAYTQATLCSRKPIEAAGGDMNKLPVTWDEFATFGEKATNLSIPRLGYAMLGMEWCAWPFTAWVWSAGGEMVQKNDDGTYKITFNDEKGVDAAMFLNQIIWKNKMTQKDVLLGTNDLANLTLNGTACFSWMGFSELSKEVLAKNGLSRSDFSVMPMPVKDSSIQRPALAGGEVITFNPKLSKDELAAAVEVAEWLYFSDERMQAMCDEIKEFNDSDIFIPGRTDWYEKKLEANTWLTGTQIEAIKKLSENAKPEPYCGHWTDVKNELVAPLQEIYLTDGITRERAKGLLDECAGKLYTLYPETFKK